jgi:hypothetical protein
MPQSSPAAPGSDRAASPLRPFKWVGARLVGGRIEVAVAETGGGPRLLAAESARTGPRGTLKVTDVATDIRRDIIYVATCCEPTSGHLRRVDARAAAPRLAEDDQGFAVDVGGPTSVIARTDTFGTLGVRASPQAEQELRADAGIADVAVEGDDGRVLALIDSRRLHALIPTVSGHGPALLVRRLTTAGSWVDATYPLPRQPSYCRVVPLAGGAVGLLAGTVLQGEAWRCVGERLDVYDTASRTVLAQVAFPSPVQHLSSDATSTFLIYTTTGGAVGWRTLAGEAGELASQGFVAADW